VPSWRTGAPARTTRKAGSESRAAAEAVEAEGHRPRAPGSIRATQWKGGGKPFGPTPRSYEKAMPREMRREDAAGGVAARVADGALAWLTA